ncbi:MAG: ASCH domain-containing protein [Planctomycetaceae bacterium]|nr:ASCH domain-containing protein [Planctomycetaceae bacterium]
MLLFKRKFLDKIRRGEKTQTIRLWKYQKMRAGQRSYIPGVGYISVESVSPIKIEDLTDGDALPDGFATAALLKQELKRIYGKEIKAGFSAYRIRFSVFSDEIQEHMRREREQRKTAETFNNFRSRESRKIESVSATLAKLHGLASEETTPHFADKRSGKRAGKTARVA